MGYEPHSGKLQRYDDKFRAGALLLLESEGYPDDRLAMGRVEKRLNIPGSTLRTWYYRTLKEDEIDSPLARTRSATKEAVAELVMAGAIEYAEEARAMVREGRHKDSVLSLMTAAGIAIDKHLLLTGQATTRHEVQSLGRIEKRLAPWVEGEVIDVEPEDVMSSGEETEILHTRVLMESRPDSLDITSPADAPIGDDGKAPRLAEPVAAFPPSHPNETTEEAAAAVISDSDSVE